jgi:hypothetical protein
MTKETIALTMSRQSDLDLFAVARALNADIGAHMASGQPSTQAHFGMIEMACAATDELANRGYLAGKKADGSDLPVDVWYETVCGHTTRLSFGVRCF